MGFFDFFKREKKLEFDINNSSPIELLNKGILFEENKIFLKWGTPIKDLSKSVELKEKLFADRTVYHWGEHKILNGLSLGLTTTYWNHREDSVYKRFNSISFSVAGDEAHKYLDLISKHLESNFGEPKSKEVSDTEIICEWIVNERRLYLHFFEQYINKLNFEISRL